MALGIVSGSFWPLAAVMVDRPDEITTKEGDE